MLTNTFSLLTKRRFAPLFLAEILQSLNDNILKHVLVIFLTLQIASRSIEMSLVLAIAGAFYLAPFLLFSPLAGVLAEKYPKAKSIRKVKFCEILVMVVASIALWSQSHILMFVVIFLLGSLSTLSAPLKYALVPEQVDNHGLLAANGWLISSVFFAALFGIILGHDLTNVNYAATLVAIVIIPLSVFSWISSLFIPMTLPGFEQLPVKWRIYRDAKNVLNLVRSNRNVFQVLLGIAWFWVVATVFIALFPSFVKYTVGARPPVASLFMGIFALGICSGALLCNRLLNSRINSLYVPLSILCMTAFIIDLAFASHGLPTNANSAMRIPEFFSHFYAWHMSVVIYLAAVCGGIFVVPLYSIAQAATPVQQRGRIFACSNVFNALMLIVAGVVVGFLLTIHVNAKHLYLLVGVVNCIVALYTCKLLPDQVVKSVSAWVLKFVYRVQIEGIENYDKAGKRVVVVANHTSFLDVLLISAFLDARFLFAVHSTIAKLPLIRSIAFMADLFVIDPLKPMQLKSLINEVKQDKPMVIFPEGRITLTGSLMKIYEGPGLIADKADATVLPIRIDGFQYTIFSRAKGVLRRRFCPQVTMTILEPMKFNVDPEIKGRRRRQIICKELYDVMLNMVFETSPLEKTLFELVLEGRKIHGGRHIILEDIKREPITYNQFVTYCFVLGKQIARQTQQGEFVGVMLPNVIGSAVTFFGLQLFGRVSVMLNFTSGVRNVVSACKSSRVKRILTSKEFVEVGGYGDIIDALKQADIRVTYLEDIRKHVKLPQKLRALIASKSAYKSFRKINKNISPDNTAVVLFTSGSEGTPKGVALSHRNMVANCYQVTAGFDLNPTDVLMSALPLFHAFGLTGGLLLPITLGIKTFLYPSPLHYRVVPVLIYECNASIMFATDTFLNGYALRASPYDFYRIRYVFAGAEKLKESTRKIWMEKYGVRILEGYGATETAPALAANTPMNNKSGTVGRFMPGIKYRLEPVPGVEHGGRLFVSGPNVMQGYFKADKPGEIQPLADGWYDTGDIVDVDDDGFVTILDRVKRFVKIAGELISLSSVESLIVELWPDYTNAVIGVPDERRGERLILFTTNPDAARKEISDFANNQGYSALMVPREVFSIKKMLTMANGKIDLQGLKALYEKEHA